MEVTKSQWKGTDMSQRRVPLGSWTNAGRFWAGRVVIKSGVLHSFPSLQTANTGIKPGGIAAEPRGQPRYLPKMMLGLASCGAAPAVPELSGGP